MKEGRKKEKYEKKHDAHWILYHHILDMCLPPM